MKIIPTQPLAFLRNVSSIDRSLVLPRPVRSIAARTDRSPERGKGPRPSFRNQAVMFPRQKIPRKAGHDRGGRVRAQALEPLNLLAFSRRFAKRRLSKVPGESRGAHRVTA
ncbi:biotin synthase [Tepidicaulis marinus]|uniref:Biotin synthase n=1 Tax=Tepidicaulis marinus TaxID=1333998 RepID=A0A081B8Z5_9HYPH|nr:biotin synthase [Tepidicaulis marinus]